jgi:MoaA/NifB/PqqE/SkfB family radical SAM enzyme
MPRSAPRDRPVTHSPRWLHGPERLAFELGLYLRVGRALRQRHGLAEGARRLRRYLADERAIPRGGGNRYLRLRGRTWAIPALPPIDSDAFVQHLLDDMEALHGPALAPLSLAMLCITPRCPYRCAYCYNAQDHGPTELLATELLVDSLRVLHREGVHNVFLSGGEPMLRTADLPGLIRAEPALGVWLVSTGWGMEPGVMGELATAGLRGVMISIDGLDAQAHDAVKGQAGAWDQACRALGICRDLGLLVGVNAMIGPALLAPGAMEAFVLRLGDLGAQFVSLNSPHPVAGDDSLEPLPVADLLAIEARAAATRRDPAWGARPLAYSPDAWEARRGCVGGQEFVYISPTGQLMSCPFLRDGIGDIRQRPLADLLGEIRGQRAGCRVCRSLRAARV